MLRMPRLENPTVDRGRLRWRQLGSLMDLWSDGGLAVGIGEAGLEWASLMYQEVALWSTVDPSLPLSSSTGWFRVTHTAMVSGFTSSKTGQVPAFWHLQSPCSCHACCYSTGQCVTGRREKIEGMSAAGYRNFFKRKCWSWATKWISWPTYRWITSCVLKILLYTRPFASYSVNLSFFFSFYLQNGTMS